MGSIPFLWPKLLLIHWHNLAHTDCIKDDLKTARLWRCERRQKTGESESNSNGISGVAFYRIRRLRKVRSILGAEITAGLVSAFILSRLDYCNAVLAHLPVSTVAPLQHVQNAAAGLTKDLRSWDQVTPALRDLHWLLIRHRIICKLCVLMHLYLCIQAAAHRICLVSWRLQRTCRSGTDSDLPTTIATHHPTQD